MISKEVYFQYCIREKFLHKSEFYFSVMTIPLQSKNKYFEIRNGKYFVYMKDKDPQEINGVSSKEPLFREEMPITLTNADLPNIAGVIDTTIGKAISNYLLLVFPFNDLIPYKNDTGWNIKKIESEIATLLRKDQITIEQLYRFGDCCSLLSTLSRIVTVSSTKKTMMAPPGLAKYKESLIKEMEKKYGKKWSSDPIHAITFQDALTKFDEEWLKDDPSFGKLLSGKAKNARSKMFLSFGMDQGLKDEGDPNEIIFNSLLEGFPKQKNALATLFNANRAGSFSRGAETVNGGVAAKAGLRSTATVIIEGEDCGSNIYDDVLITKDNIKNLGGRYYLKGNKLEPIDDTDNSLIGKTLQVRSPLYCKYQDKVYCTVCCGEKMRGRRNGIVAAISDITGAILNNSMKKMHNTVKKLHKIDLKETLC